MSSRYDWSNDPESFFIYRYEWGEWVDPWGHTEAAFVILDAAYVSVTDHAAVALPEEREGWFDDTRRVEDSDGRRFFPSSEYGSLRPPEWILSAGGEEHSRWRSKFDQSEWTCPIRLVQPDGAPFLDRPGLIAGDRLVDTGTRHRRDINSWHNA